MNPINKAVLAAAAVGALMTTVAVVDGAQAQALRHRDGPGFGRFDGHSGGRGPGAHLFGRADGNGDGVIERAEAEAVWAQTFERLDEDADGYITQAEVDAARDRMRERFRERRGERADRAQPQRPEGARRGPHGQLFEKADADGDGKISRDEFTAHSGARFDEIDSDADGRVTREELAALRGQRGRR